LEFDVVSLKAFILLAEASFLLEGVVRSLLPFLQFDDESLVLLLFELVKFVAFSSFVCLF